MKSRGKPWSHGPTPQSIQCDNTQPMSDALKTEEEEEEELGDHKSIHFILVRRCSQALTIGLNCYTVKVIISCWSGNADHN